MREKTVLLINPNLLKPPVSPVALDMIGEALEEKGYKVEVADLAFCSSVEEALEQLGKALAKEYLMILVSIRNIDDSSLMSMDFILQKTKILTDEIKKLAKAPIVAGGVGFSIFPENTLEYLDLEYGIVGDGEKAVCELASIFEDELEPYNIKGLMIRSARSTTFKAPDFSDISAAKPLKRNIVDNERYFREGAMVGWETKRGCPHACAYCADPFAKGRKSRFRSPEASVEELVNLLNRGINVFHTCDCEFNIPESHALSICDEIIKKGIGNKIEWFAYCSPYPFSEELAEKMALAGCKGINFGADAACDSILRALGRNHTTKNLYQIADFCRKNKISTMFDLLIGSVSETRETLKETIENIKDINPDVVGISLGVRIYPDTVYAEQYRNFNSKEREKSIYGKKENNDDFFYPIYYLSDKIGSSKEEIIDYIELLIDGDKRFLFNLEQKNQNKQNYNYNNNNFLENEIKKGKKGAFWHILSDGNM